MGNVDHMYIKPTDGVEWGAPKTIRQLIAQLETMNPDTKVHGATFTEYGGKQVARCRYLGMSFERVDQPWIREKNHDVPYSLVFWTREDSGVRTPPDIPSPATSSGGALAAIAAERQRQIAKGYDAAHDDSHKGGEIVLADWGARARIEAAINAGRAGDSPVYKELLTEAAAQCVAEIERVERAEGEANA